MPIGITGRLYTDLQCTQFFHVGDNEDLQPTLYLKIGIPGTDYVIGAMYLGGVTDYRTDIVFVADKNGNIKSSLEGTILTDGLSTKQYKVTEDYKVITSQLILTSQTSLLYKDFIGSGKSIEAYRLNTTYSINSQGKFVKEEETALPTKTYTEEQLVKFNIWDL